MTTPRTIFGYDLDADVRAVESMAAALVPYVYQDELYGMQPGTLPRLTVGSLLMRLHRLPLITDLLTPRQQQVVTDALKRLAEVRQEWHVAYTGKIKREFKARADALDQFFNDCNDNPRGCADNYPASMEKRVMLERLYREAEALGELTEEMQNRLPIVDNAIGRFVEKATFCWDPRLERVYLPEAYWYLYRAVVPKQPGKAPK
jgi:hypothetical protein